jgi:hypothetical protein
MRLTRAAQRAQQPLDEPSSDATEAAERSPLNEITPNASPEHVDHAEEAPKPTLARSKSKKGGKKGAKAKKGKVAEEQQDQVVPDNEQQTTDDSPKDAEVEDAGQVPSEGMRRSDCASHTIINMIVDVLPTASADERPASPAPKAVRLTRRQLAKQEEEFRQPQRAQSPPQELESEPATEDVAQSPIAEAEEEVPESKTSEDIPKEEEEETAAEAQTEAAAGPEELPQIEVEEQQQEKLQHVEATESSPVIEDASSGAQETEVFETNEAVASAPKEVEEAQPSAQELEAGQQIEPDDAAPSVEVTSEPEPKTLAAEKPSDVTRTPVMSRTTSRRTSRSPSKSPMRIEESIEALDALEEALENVGKAVSHFDSSTEEKSPRKKAFPRDATTPSARTKTPRKTPVAARVSRTPSAAPKSMKPTISGLARASSVRIAPMKDVRKGSTDTVDYLASKRRPVSVSFPTPPPPPKGRAPTKPTFQLSSDAVAAKLKAQKEERAKREAEREAEGAPVKQRPISMPPVAKSTKAPTKANFQLPGEAIAAKLRAQKEERQKREAENAQAEHPKPRPVSISMPPPTVKSTKSLTKATFQLSGDAVAARLKAQREERQKREEEAEAAKKAAASKARPVRKPVALPTRATPGITIPPPPPKSDTLQPPPQRSTSLTSKRTSIQLSRLTSTSTNASNRNSLLVSKATVTPVDAVQQKLKGKEVFNRDRIEKDAKDRERREKEDAAKQARAQAAERGRIASREWAEKQRKKMMDAVRSKAEAA